MNIDKELLRLKYPFLKKTGILHMDTPFNIGDIAKKWRNEKILIVMVGVQGSGKTTYCKEHFSDFPVINVDDILINYLETSGEMFSAEVNRKVNMIFFDNVNTALKTRGLAIVDAGAVHLNFRVLLLGAMQKKFTKAILIVLNPTEGKIIRQVKGDLERRARPGLWQDISKEYILLQDQIRCHILEMGVDEVYML